MKVFAYNVNTGEREDIIDTIGVPSHLMNKEMIKCKLPQYISPDASWKVFTYAADRNNIELTYDYPVCFCMGKMRCGEEPEFWDWVILLPKSGETK